MPSFVSIVKSVAGALLPKDSDDYVPIRPVPQKKNRFGFGRVIASGVDPTFGSVLTPLGTGMTVAQSGGNLNLGSGININQDTIIRSNFTVTDPFTLRWSTVLSQRIANQQFIVELVDVIGDGLACTIVNTTTINVTIPNHGWDTRNYGQTVGLGNYAGTGGITPINSQASVITAISGNVVTFTTSGCTAGTGTISVFGWNYHRFTYDATSATSYRFQSQRNGWPGTGVTLSSNTTASPGHIGIYNCEDNIGSMFEQLRASSGSNQTASRGNAVQDLPSNETVLYLQIRMMNGSTAPTATTWTIAFIDMEDYIPQQVTLTGVRTITQQNLGIPAVLTGGNATFSPTTPTGYYLTAAATTNAVAIRAAACRLHELSIYNPTAVPIYVKLYNKTTAPTVGTDVPTVTIPVAAGALFSQGFPPMGKSFNVGLALATTTNAAATDNTALATAGVQISASYI